MNAESERWLRFAYEDLQNRFYIPTRYPDTLPGMLPAGLPNQDDAEEALIIVQQVLETVRSLVEQEGEEEEEGDEE